MRAPPRFEPTRAAALQRVAAVRPTEYARTRNAIDGAVTRLSPYITHGFVTLPEVLAAVRANPSTLGVVPVPIEADAAPWWPLLAALFTAGFFLLLTVKALTLSAICGVLTVVCIYGLLGGGAALRAYFSEQRRLAESRHRIELATMQAHKRESDLQCE